jgi:hypothetical protein
VNIKTIPVVAYTDPQGLPTCAVDIGTKQVCKFHRVAGFGTRDVCALAEDGAQLERRGELGYLIPLKSCPVWKDAT